MNGSGKTRSTVNRDLNASQREQSIVRIETSTPDSTGIEGIVLANTKALVAVYEIAGFEGDGATVFSRSAVKSVRRGKFERCATAVMGAAGGLAGLKRFAWLATVESLEDVVRALHARDTWPAVEVAFKRKTVLYVGKVVEASDDAFRMHCYDAAGAWEDEYELTYAEIVKVEIESRYLTHFNSYMKRKGLPR